MSQTIDRIGWILFNTVAVLLVLMPGVLFGGIGYVLLGLGFGADIQMLDMAFRGFFAGYMLVCLALMLPIMIGLLVKVAIEYLNKK